MSRKKGIYEFLGLDLRSDSRSKDARNLTVATNVVTRNKRIESRPGYNTVVKELGTAKTVMGISTYVPVEGDRSIVIVREDGIYLYKESE